VFFLQTSLCLYVFCMLYCIVRFSSTTFALVPLIIGRQLVELCVFLATCHIAFKYVYLLANKVIVWPDALVSQTAYLSIAYLSLYLYCLSTGAQRFYDDIRIMVGHQPSAWWNISLRYLTPVILLVSSSWLRARKKNEVSPRDRRDDMPPPKAARRRHSVSPPVRPSRNQKSWRNYVGPRTSPHISGGRR